MKPLRDLVRIYDDILKNKTSKFIRAGFNKKEEQLFNALQSGVTENLIARKIYGAGPSHQSYQSLKRSLKEKLYAIVMTSNVGKSYQKQRMDVSREFLVVKVLTVLKMRYIAVPLAEKTLRKCLKFRMYHEAAELGRLLSEHHTVFTKKNTKGREFHELSVRCIDIYRLELEYAWKYSYYRSLYGTAAFEAHLDEFRVTADELEKSFELESTRLAFFYFELRFFQFYLEKDNEAIIDICHKAIAYFDNLPFQFDSIRNIFVFHLIEHYLTVNSLYEAEDTILQFLKNTDSGTSAYYRYKELLLRLYLFQGNRLMASHIFKDLKKSMRRQNTIFTKDRLVIYEMYLALLSDQTLNFRKINYNLNRVKQDKKGLHVPFLIAQAIYYYLHDPDKLIDKLDALNQYAYKYLQSDNFLRTRQFIRILNRIMSGKSYADISLELDAEKISNYALEMVSYDVLLDFIQSRQIGSYSQKALVI